MAPSAYHYGLDTYEFAKANPLLFLAVDSLLHLLEKYGHTAKIDLKEAKQILGGKQG